MGDANRLAHTLKGVAAMLEAKDLANAAAAVEDALREERLENLDLLIDDLEAKLRPALTAVASLEGGDAGRIVAHASPCRGRTPLSAPGGR
jgi:two-component system, sensor histidine kinase and response regulator